MDSLPEFLLYPLVTAAVYGAGYVAAAPFRRPLSDNEVRFPTAPVGMMFLLPVALIGFVGWTGITGGLNGLVDLGRHLGWYGPFAVLLVGYFIWGGIRLIGWGLAVDGSGVREYRGRRELRSIAWSDVRELQVNPNDPQAFVALESGKRLETPFYARDRAVLEAAFQAAGKPIVRTPR